MEALKKKMAALKAEKDDAVEKAEELTAELKESKQKEDAMDDSCQAKDRKIRLLECDLDKVEDDHALKCHEVKTHAADIEELQRENKKLKRDIQLLEDEQTGEGVEQLRAKVKELVDTVEEKDRENASLRRLLKAAEDDLEMAEEKCTKAEDDLKEMVAELGEI